MTDTLKSNIYILSARNFWGGKNIWLQAKMLPNKMQNLAFSSSAFHFNTIKASKGYFIYVVWHFSLIFVQLLSHTRQKTFHSKGMSRLVLFLQHIQSSISHQSLSKIPTGVYLKVKRWVLRWSSHQFIYGLHRDKPALTPTHYSSVFLFIHFQGKCQY